MWRPGGSSRSHGATHAPLDRDDPGFLERELHGSRELLERTLGVPVQTLAWPYGLRSEAAERAARDAGYATACGGSGGRVRLRDPLFALPRVDAHYLRRRALLRATLRGSGTAYLGARRAGARARRLLLKDYATKGAA